MDRRNWSIAHIHQDEMLEQAQRARLAALGRDESESTPSEHRWRTRVVLAMGALLLVMILSLLYISTVPALVVLGH